MRMGCVCCTPHTFPPTSGCGGRVAGRWGRFGFFLAFFVPPGAEAPAMPPETAFPALPGFPLVAKPLATQPVFREFVEALLVGIHLEANAVVGLHHTKFK